MYVSIFAVYDRSEIRVVYCDLDAEEGNGGVGNRAGEIKRGMKILNKGKKGI